MRKRSLPLVLKRGLQKSRGLALPSRLAEVKTLVERTLENALPALVKAPPEVEAGRFIAASFSNTAGTRPYKLYIPSAYHGQPLPLVVMLHGCTQSPDDFATGTRMNAVAEERGCFVAYPGQTSAANPSKCWNWFNPSDQLRDGGEPSIVAGITRAIVREYNIDPRCVYVAGLSAGAAAVAVLGATYPELYAALGIHSGLPNGCAHDALSAFSAMRNGGVAAAHTPRDVVPTIVFHGDRDNTVNARNGAQIVASGALGAAAPTHEEGRVSAGRSYTKSSYRGPTGELLLEHWVVHGAGHAWAGGSKTGSFTDPQGPDASREMMRFFIER